MGLRCLLGHDFDEPETERERNEEGNEVVVTVREVKTCKRCGEKQVVSENKEITSIEQLRETATEGQPSTSTDAGGAAAESTDTTETTETTLDDEWSTDDLSTGRVESGVDETASDTETAVDADVDETATTADAESEPTADPIERGVADIIEQAEKDDEMLESSMDDADEETASEPGPPDVEESAPVDDQSESAAEADEDVPVHPGERSAGAEESPDDGPDPESDDGVILDEDEASRPEDARRQWEEEASPEEVPGKDMSVGEPAAPDGEDAEIIDGEGGAAHDESTQPGADDEPEQHTETHSAIDSEDAEIMDAGPEPAESPEPEPSESPTQPEESDEGHMPWPDAPGEDEGHDATEPDGEPADVDFGGGLTPSDAESEAADPSSADSSPADSSSADPSPADPSPADPTEEPEPDVSDEPVDRAESPGRTEPDRANGDRTASGEPSDTSATPTSNVDLERSTRDANMEYYCPECGLTRDVGNSSMRAGDICPDCRKGYITEQQKAE